MSTRKVHTPASPGLERAAPDHEPAAMSATVLRVHAPEACDSAGRPYGWAVCGDCTGGIADSGGTVRPCTTCAGTDSIEARALREYLEQRGHTTGVVRCEQCRHPRSDGAWDPPNHVSALNGSTGHAEEHALLRQRFGHCPVDTYGTHHSPCDPGCEHRGPVSEQAGPLLARPSILQTPPALVPITFTAERPSVAAWLEHVTVYASWRRVALRVGQPFDGMNPNNPLHVRPFDLRVERLAVLCLRCWARRTPIPSAQRTPAGVGIDDLARPFDAHPRA